MVAGDRALEGVEGSSTWRGIARDRLLELPDSWLRVTGAETLLFITDGPVPDEAFLTVFQEASVANRSMRALRGIELDARQPSWRVELPTGRYLITLSRTWQGSENVAHAFGIEVRSPNQD